MNREINLSKSVNKHRSHRDIKETFCFKKFLSERKLTICFHEQILFHSSFFFQMHKNLPVIYLRMNLFVFEFKKSF